MPRMAGRLIITERQQEVLHSLVWSRSCPQGLAHRAEIILLAFEGLRNEPIAERLGCDATASASGVAAGRRRSSGWWSSNAPRSLRHCGRPSKAS